MQLDAHYCRVCQRASATCTCCRRHRRFEIAREKRREDVDDEDHQGDARGDGARGGIGVVASCGDDDGCTCSPRVQDARAAGTRLPKRRAHSLRESLSRRALKRFGAVCPGMCVCMCVQLPVLAVLCFGVYSIASIVYSLIVFRDVPEELQVLQRDIALARKELAKKGFKSS